MPRPLRRSPTAPARWTQPDAAPARPRTGPPLAPASAPAKRSGRPADPARRPRARRRPPRRSDRSGGLCPGPAPAPGRPTSPGPGRPGPRPAGGQTPPQSQCSSPSLSGASYRLWNDRGCLRLPPPAGMAGPGPDQPSLLQEREHVSDRALITRRPRPNHRWEPGIGWIENRVSLLGPLDAPALLTGGFLDVT